jgi:three-Cys-motif partner protein
MDATHDECYFGREQSLLKHIVLEKYLERFAIIVGKTFDEILYIDGFSGPWNAQSENLDDTSFSIALRRLRQARDVVKKMFGRDLRIRCIFLEREPEPFCRLKKFAEEQRDVTIIPLNLEFEVAVPELVASIRNAGRGCFPFIFIDPTGWTGFSMRTIAPLLQVDPGEVLVNFMTGFILRFAEDSREGIDASFQDLFGDATFRNRLANLEGRDREDALVFEYADRIKTVGRFAHVPVAVVPHPTRDRTHFHLVYGTRNLRGLEVFKAAEKKALSMVPEIRADAKRRKREAHTHQAEFFGGTEVPDNGYVAELASHYGALARTSIHRLIRTKGELSFDEVYAKGMSFPTVQIDSVRAWISEVADVVGLGDRERVGKAGVGHRVRLRDPSGSACEFRLQEDGVDAD